MNPNEKKDFIYEAGFKQAIYMIGMHTDILKSKKGISADYIKAIEDVQTELISK